MNIFLPLLLFCALLLSSTTSNADTITVLRQFLYGDLTILDNDAARSLTIAPDGTITNNPSEIVVLSDGDSAQIRLTGFPTNTTVTVSFLATNILFEGTGPQFFTISSAVTSPSTITTDGAGESIFNVGTTLSTSGNGNYYSDGNYSGTIDITVNY